MKIERRKIKSLKLGRDVEIQGYTYNGMFLASHYSLEKLVSEINLVDKIRLSINIDNPVVIPNGTIPYIIYTGYVSDGDSTIPCNGDAFELSLNNDISKKYPGEMAFKRCYDRGVLTWLYLETKDGQKIYSDSEMDMVFSLPKEEYEEVSIEPEEVEVVVEESPVEKTSEVEVPVVVEEEPTSFTIEEDSTPLPPIEEATPSSDLEDIVITIGKFKKNPMQISEIIKNGNSSWLHMAVENNWVSDQPTKEIIKKWLERTK